MFLALCYRLPSCTGGYVEYSGIVCACGAFLALTLMQVRAVFEVYGVLEDPDTGKPLFNADAWKKAQNVLDEIEAGHCSDPPDSVLYIKQVCYELLPWPVL